MRAINPCAVDVLEWVTLVVCLCGSLVGVRAWVTYWHKWCRWSARVCNAGGVDGVLTCVACVVIVIVETLS